MKKKIKIIKANPAGNITVFIRNKFEREQYQDIAKQIFKMKKLGAEQVSFIKETQSCGRADGKMEMSGLEFCGNGSRSFGLIKAMDMGIRGKSQIFVDVSGCNEILTVDVDTENGYTKVKMPLPNKIREIDLSNLKIELCEEMGRCVNRGNSNAVSSSAQNSSGYESDKLIGDKVDFEGITHIVLKCVKPSEENFKVIRDYIMEKYNPLAVGVMFCGKNDNEGMVPVVYVRDVDTTYFEGSCGSGTVAAAISFSKSMIDGVQKFCFPQPAGEIDSTIIKSKGIVSAVYIEGIVSLSEELEVEVEV